MKPFAYLAQCYALSGAAAMFLARWALVFAMLAVRVYAFVALVRLAHLAAVELYDWLKKQHKAKDRHGPVAPMAGSAPPETQDGPRDWNHKASR